MGVDIPGGLAASVTQPGETAGTAAGEPLPEGLYLANTAGLGLPDHRDPEFLSRHYNSGCYLGDALDVARREGAILFGDAGDRDLCRQYSIQCASVVQSGSVRAIGLTSARVLASGYAFGSSYFGIDEPRGVEFYVTQSALRAELYGRRRRLGPDRQCHRRHPASKRHQPAPISPCPAPFGLNGCNPNFLKR